MRVPILDDLFVNILKFVLDLLGRFLPSWAVSLFRNFIVALALVIFAIVAFICIAWLERKVVARIQDRYGPNRASRWGLLQPIADAIKMFTKEDIAPLAADRWVHLLAPMIGIVMSLLTFAVIPFGKGMIGADLNVGIVYAVAILSVDTVAILMAGWGSNNKYSLLAGMRAVAQMISYEVPMGLSIMVVVMLSRSLSTVSIVEAQSGWLGLRWFILFFPIGPLAFLIYFISGLAELNRVPFDILEAESEIIAGYHIEYSGMKFALLLMAEYINMFLVCAIGATLFLGGWQGPVLPPYVWFLAKTFALMLVMMWIRDTLPRLRIDQLMGFAWKLLVPLALLNIMLTGVGIEVFQYMGWV